MNHSPLSVTITSDFMCPWCFIAERRLRAAAERAGVDVALTFRPYELNPAMPPEGMDRRAYRSAKFGSWERSQSLDAGTIAAARDDDLTFRYEKITVTPNTRLAHRLMWFVRQHAPETAAVLADTLFEAYFSYGRHIGLPDVLADVARPVGLDRPVVSDFLRSDRGVAEVEGAERQAAESGVRGVPHIEVESYVIHGAQSLADMVRALRRASESRP